MAKTGNKSLGAAKKQKKDSQKRSAYERQSGMCADCGRHFEFEEMHGDHKIPWAKGGHTVPENLQMLCRACNVKKGGK